VFLRYGEKSVWLTDFLNLERDEKSKFLGREFQTLITLSTKKFLHRELRHFVDSLDLRNITTIYL